MSYGELADNRHALRAVLEAAKDRVGPARQAKCDALIQALPPELALPPESEQPGSEPAETLPAVDVQILQQTYLQRVLELCGEVTLSGIDRKTASRESDARLSLGEIYTALLTLHAERDEHGRGKGRNQEDMAKLMDQKEVRRLSAVAQLNAHKRLVLLGDPGSGKSTFVNFVAICLAGAQVENPCADLQRLTAPLPDDEGQPQEKAQPWTHGALLPVRVILRDFAAEGLPAEDERATAKHLWQFITNRLQEAGLGDYAPYLRQHLLKTGGLVLLDGLDEVPEAHARRAHIKQAVEDFAWTFSNCRMLVTSRTYAYQQQEWRLARFEEAVLSPFTRGQIIRFVDQWYTQSAPLLDMRPDDAGDRAELLKRAILSNDRLYSFVQRPLLLTLMASLHAWRGGSLPERREELYNDAVELLLDWWESHKVKGKVQSLSEALNLGREGLNGLRSMIGALAYEAHGAQPDLVGTANIAEDRLAGALMRLSEKTDLDPRQVRDYLRDRAGLLVSHGVEMCTFPHRTFQEYLAACHLTEDQNNYPDNVAGLARKDPNRWREVVLLAGAKAARGAAASIWVLAEALCFRDYGSAPGSADIPVGVSANSPARMPALLDAWGALLAAQALVENVDVSQVYERHRPKVERIREWLIAILTEQVSAGTVALSKVEAFPATERALAGNLLAVLGDTRPGVGVREDSLPDILWCEVPEGPFTMGSDPQQDAQANDQEQPQHEVYVSAFEISRYPVTNAQFQAFVDDGGYDTCGYWSEDGWKQKEKEGWTGPEKYGGAFDLPNHPVVGVSYYEAEAFCVWLTERLKEAGNDAAAFSMPALQNVHLPTEAQWEKAARGTDERVYPWGGEITPEYANYGDTGLGVTSAVGCFPRGVSPYGCEDMAGNVWEWCHDWLQLDYYADSPERDPQGPDSGEDILGEPNRVYRGGSWRSDARDVRCAFRYRHWPRLRVASLGFRPARIYE